MIINTISQGKLALILSIGYLIKAILLIWINIESIDSDIMLMLKKDDDQELFVVY